VQDWHVSTVVTQVPQGALQGVHWKFTLVKPLSHLLTHWDLERRGKLLFYSQVIQLVAELEQVLQLLSHFTQ
jgi:hypothetical protein